METTLYENENNMLQDKELINIQFNKCIKGYHLVNTSPINETIWEDINAVVFTNIGMEVYSKSDGKHSSGMDIHSSLGRISNKSAKYSNTNIKSKSKKINSDKKLDIDINIIKKFDISSYRLTTVCSEKKCGTPELFIAEINKRKNFDYYSFIVRDESNEATILYDWLLIPSDYFILDPSSYSWEPTFGKRAKNKESQVGWHTNSIHGCSMSITFSMSSQLWIHIEVTPEIKKFIVASGVVNNKPIYNYIQLLDYLENHQK